MKLKFLISYASSRDWKKFFFFLKEDVDTPIDDIKNGESSRENDSWIFVDEIHIFDLG